MCVMHQVLKLGLGTAEDSRASLRPNNEVGQESISVLIHGPLGVRC